MLSLSIISSQIPECWQIEYTQTQAKGWKSVFSEASDKHKGREVEMATWGGLEVKAHTDRPPLNLPSTSLIRADSLYSALESPTGNTIGQLRTLGSPDV